MTITKPPQRLGKRERTKAANRDAILQAGRRVFARLGIEATTVRDIIRETDLAAGTFYNYFKSKEEIFQAIADESTKRFRPKLAMVRENVSTLEEYIRAAYGEYFKWLKDENQDDIRNGAPHAALIGVRVDTPEMHAVFDEIRSDLESMAKEAKIALSDSEYFTAAAIGIARELGDHMLQRRPINVEGATEFATRLLLEGGASLAQKTE